MYNAICYSRRSCVWCSVFSGVNSDYDQVGALVSAFAPINSCIIAHIVGNVMWFLTLDKRCNIVNLSSEVFVFCIQHLLSEYLGPYLQENKFCCQIIPNIFTGS